MHTKSDLATAIAEAKAISDWIGAALGETATIARQQDAFAIAYLTLALEHREAVLALACCDARSSALALLRPLWEATVCGSWVAEVATDAELQKIKHKHIVPKLGTMILSLQRQGSTGNVLGAFQRSHGPALDDFVHGGPRQVSRWMGPDGITPMHSDALMVDALAFADAVGLLACATRESVAGRPVLPHLDRLDRILERRRSGSP